jgi:hypothetical protein
MSVSRYAGAGTLTWTAPDGRQIRYLNRRLLPQPAMMATLRRHTVRASERADSIAATELGDAELSWQLADANDAMRPSELAQPGRVLAIPLPAGVPGPANAQ